MKLYRPVYWWILKVTKTHSKAPDSEAQIVSTKLRTRRLALLTELQNPVWLNNLAQNSMEWPHNFAKNKDSKTKKLRKFLKLSALSEKLRVSAKYIFARKLPSWMQSNVNLKKLIFIRGNWSGKCFTIIRPLYQGATSYNTIYVFSFDHRDQNCLYREKMVSRHLGNVFLNLKIDICFDSECLVNWEFRLWMIVGDPILQ